MEEGGRPHECTAVQIVINQYGDGDTAGDGIGAVAKVVVATAVAQARWLVQTSVQTRRTAVRCRSRRCRWPWGRAFIVRTSLLIQTHTHLRIVFVCENVCLRLRIHSIYLEAHDIHRTDAPSMSACVSVHGIRRHMRARAHIRRISARIAFGSAD